MILTGTGIIDSAKTASVVVQWVAVGASTAAGTNKIAYSGDGLNWIRGTITDNSNITTLWSVCYNGTKWVAVGQGTNKVVTSSDGKTWTSNAGLNAMFTIVRSIAWNGTYFLATGTRLSTTGSSVAYSSDGVTWTGNGTSLFGITSWQGYSVYWTGTYWYIGFFNAVSPSPTFGYTSVLNGISGWTSVTLPTNVIENQVQGIAYNGTRTVIAGRSANLGTKVGLAYTGANPASTGWTGITSVNQGISVAYSNYGPGRFVAIGSPTGANSSAQFSQDGVTWSNSTNGNAIFGSPTWGSVGKIAWNGSMYIATIAGATTNAAYSYDGDTWYTSSLSSISTALYAIASKTAPNLYPPLP
jgi:hypothetical protein